MGPIRFMAAVVAVLVWVLALVLPLGWGAYVVAALVTVGAIVGVVLVAHRDAVARAGRTRLDAAVEARARAATPEQRQGLFTLQEDLRDAMTRSAGAPTPGAVPWYLVLGAPGAGKTSALQSSGQPFTYMTPEGSARDPHRCRWWLAPEAVYIDSAGAYVAREEAYAEWLGLLALLGEHRPAQPLHGIVVVVGADLLAGGASDDVEALARRLRERIDEATAYLGVDVPAYLLVARCDLVAGFREAFADLRDAERGQLWGFTRPFAEATPPGQWVGAHFDRLVAALSQRTLRRMAGERQIEVRAAVYQFPQWFAALRPNLVALTGTLFASSVYRDAAPLRGVYFASVLPESAQPNAYNAAYRPGATERGWFLRDVFREVVLPDREFARRSVTELRRRRRRRYAVAAALGTVAVLATALPLDAYVANLGIAGDLDDDVAAVARRGAGPVAVAELDALRADVSDLDGYRTDGAPVFLRFGMFVGDALYPRAATLFGAIASRDVGAPVMRREAAELAAFVGRHPTPGAAPTADERAYYGDSLRLYLFLTTPRMPDDLALTDPTQRRWFNTHLVQSWNAFHATASSGDLHGLMRVADLYARLLAADARLASPRDLTLVARVRGILGE